MGEKTSIVWTDHTFNPWWGCAKVSPGCTRCYAATFDKRVHGKDSEHWKVDGPRRHFGDAHWREPEKWNRAAEKSGVRRRVFCASMADVFEDRRDLAAERVRLWHLIKRTPHLDWLLLTKRPENMRAMLPWTCVEGDASWGTVPWCNVWLGATMEDQEHADERWRHLREMPAVVRFASCEPLLGPIVVPPVDWCIVGCESGHGARPASVDWYRSLRDQCAADGRPFLLKQAVEREGEPRLYGISVGDGSFRKGPSLIEAPHLDGKQHLAWPEPRSAR